MWAGSPFGRKTKKKREVWGGEGGKKPGPSLMYTGGTYSKILRLNLEVHGTCYERWVRWTGSLESCVKPLNYNTFLKNALNACAFHCQHNRCKQYFPSPSIYFGDGPRDQKRIYCVE